jgi:hypothetical protein
MTLQQSLALGLIFGGLLCGLASFVGLWVYDLRAWLANRRRRSSHYPAQAERLRHAIREQARSALLLFGMLQVLSGIMLIPNSAISRSWLLIYTVLLLTMVWQLLVSVKALGRAIGEYLALWGK